MQQVEVRQHWRIDVLRNKPKIWQCIWHYIRCQVGCRAGLSAVLLLRAHSLFLLASTDVLPSFELIDLSLCLDRLLTALFNVASVGDTSASVTVAVDFAVAATDARGVAGDTDTGNVVGAVAASFPATFTCAGW